PGVENALTPPPVVLPRTEDRGGRDQGQYGFALRYYAEWMGQGTDIGLYFVNFHSKLPFGTFTALNDTTGFNFMGLMYAGCGGDLNSPLCTTSGLNFTPTVPGVHAGWG